MHDELAPEVKQVIDVRLHNTSQLAGIAKADDLAYFLKEICGVAYTHAPILAPADEMLKAYKRDKGDWALVPGLGAPFVSHPARRFFHKQSGPV